MVNSLLFIPDISGFTNFVQTTEVEHSQHVIAELLEVLIAANTQHLKLAEVEGDALFFYKENQILSQEKLLAQIETMYTAFYSHLKLLEKHRICPCLACSSAVNLKLKIIAHSGNLQFIEVQKNRKPFGETVIQAHRLLKNSIESDNYVLISKDLANEIKMTSNYSSSLFQFINGEDVYDNKTIAYQYSEIAIENLKLKPFKEKQPVVLNKPPNMVFEREFNTNANQLLEIIANYKYKHLWSIGVTKITYNPNEVTRINSSHVCVIGENHFNFNVVVKKNKNGELVYGEKTTSPPPVDVLYQFYNIEKVSENKSKLTLEIYWEAKSIIKKIMLALFVKKLFAKNINTSLNKLAEIL